MKHINCGRLFSIVFATLFFSLNTASASLPTNPTEADWSNAFGKFEAPHIIFKNESALRARLRMLDYAPAGSEAIVLSFVYENGETTRKLAAHICKAQQRGVKVRWMTDSKWGSLAGEENMFDHPWAEETFQYMANCGVEVRIHNHYSEFSSEGVLGTVTGKIIPAKKYWTPGNGAEAAQVAVNRLDHRKLFWVKTPEGQAFYLLGGRNLGDHYLAWHSGGDSFVDSDIMICNHYKQDPKSLPYATQAEFEKTVAQAKASFESLWNDDENGLNGDLEGHAPLEIYRVPNNPNYEFKLVFLEEAEGRDAKEFSFGKGLKNSKGKDASLGMIPAAGWANGEVPQGRAFRNSYDWDIKTSIWNPEHDHVRAALHDMVRREQAEIYLESAYMDFDPEIKPLLKAALKRGVRVTVISNSIYTSDAGSKLIPVTRGEFINDLLSEYGKDFTTDFNNDYYNDPRQNYQSPGADNGRFEFYVMTPFAGHMMHFKGAGFKCQKADDGSFYKSFIIGSHNFHVRSGLADKEHALTWKEPVDLTCFNRHYTYTLDGSGEMKNGAAIKAKALAETGMDYDDIVARHSVLDGGGYGLLSADNRDLIEWRMRYWSGVNKVFEKHNKAILLAFPNLKAEVASIHEQDPNKPLIKKALGWMSSRVYEDYDPAKISKLKPGPKKILNMLSPIRNFISSFL